MLNVSRYDGRAIEVFGRSDAIGSRYAKSSIFDAKEYFDGMKYHGKSL